MLTTRKLSRMGEKGMKSYSYRISLKENVPCLTFLKLSFIDKDALEIWNVTSFMT